MDGEIIRICLLPQFRQDGVPGTGEGNMGTDHRIVSDVDMGVVHAGQPEIGIDVAAEMQVTSALA